MAPETPTDLELLEAARDGDYDAFEQIVLRFRDRVFRLAYGMTHDDAASEELVQDVFLNIFGPASSSVVPTYACAACAWLACMCTHSAEDKRKWHFPQVPSFLPIPIIPQTSNAQVDRLTSSQLCTHR